MKPPILLIGGGGHCKACIDVIEQEGAYHIAGIVDVSEKCDQTVLGYPIIGTDADLANLIKSYPNALVTVGQIKSPTARIKLFDAIKQLGGRFPVIQSPVSYVSKHAHIGEGTIVMHHALINSGASIGRNCIINTKALVEHDAIIEDHCHISTGALVNGGVRIGSGSFFGSGSVSKEYTWIWSGSFIKANSLVSKKK